MDCIIADSSPQPHPAPDAPAPVPTPGTRGTPPLVPPCPTCGQSSPPFSLPVSHLLDWLTIAKDALSEAQAALEGEVLP